jgi:hypothetical protein
VAVAEEAVAVTLMAGAGAGAGASGALGLPDAPVSLDHSDFFSFLGSTAGAGGADSTT